MSCGEEAPRGPKQIQSVAKAMRILDLLRIYPNGLSLLEISQKLNISKSTIHGILSTMRNFEYIDQFALDGTYRLGIRLFEAGNAIANTMSIRKVAAPYIHHLVDTMNETVHLAILDAGEVLYIDKQECRQSIRIVSEVGARLPAHCTGVGKVLLAYLSESDVKRIIAERGLKRFTSYTITDMDKLHRELAEIRVCGYGMDREEIMESVQCVAAPIRDHEGKVCAAVSASGFCMRMRGKLPQITAMIIDAAQSISSELGYQTGKNTVRKRE